MKFIHAADLHIDSPLKGLEAYEGAPAEAARQATRQALVKLVDHALEQEADLVLIAGDLFDGQWRNMETGLWTAAQFRRLDKQQIPVVMIRGNHDAASRMRRTIQWPANVHELSTRKPQTLVFDRLGVAVHGQGFAQIEVPEDLASGYPQRVANLFNVGLLHTSLTGHRDHDSYAPTSLDVLKSLGYDYWALGHVHARSEPPLCDEPFIAYSGNTQGRHVKETGPKGCLLVQVDDRQLAGVEFLATDSLRWYRQEIELRDRDRTADLYQQVDRTLRGCQEQSQGRYSAVRLTIRGNCQAHTALSQDGPRREVLAEIRNLANELDEVWVEKVIFDTSPPIDLDRLRNSQDLLGELFRDLDQRAQDLESLFPALNPLRDKAEVELAESGVDLKDEEMWRQWLHQAQGLLAERLMETES